MDGTNTYTPKKVSVTSSGLSGSLQDALGGGITGLDVSVVFGNLSINSPTALAIDNASAQSNGSYTRFSYGANRLQRFTDSTFLALSVSGHGASKNLDSSGKFSLGGINGVRAYPQGEASGDEGYRATVELRHNVIPNVQATVFYDVGKVTINRQPFGPPALNSRNLAGMGVGVNASLGTVQLRSSLAWRTDGDLPTSIPASAARRPTLWMQASVAF